LRSKSRKKSPCRVLGEKIKSWRGPIKRDRLARAAEIPTFSICVVEHYRAHQIRTGDLIKLIETLRELRTDDAESMAQECHKLLKLIPQTKRTCHRQSHGHRPSVRR
jgi:hypothetical protein